MRPFSTPVWVKFGGRKFRQFKKILAMRASLLYLGNFQNLELENCDIITVSLKRASDTLEIYFL